MKRKVSELLENGKSCSDIHNKLYYEKQFEEEQLPSLMQIQNLKQRMAQNHENLLGLRNVNDFHEYFKDQVAITNNPELLAQKGMSHNNA
jgi:hypothetical protein